MKYFFCLSGIHICSMLKIESRYVIRVHLDLTFQILHLYRYPPRRNNSTIFGDILNFEIFFFLCVSGIHKCSMLKAKSRYVTRVHLDLIFQISYFLSISHSKKQKLSFWFVIRHHLVSNFLQHFFHKITIDSFFVNINYTHYFF